MLAEDRAVALEHGAHDLFGVELSPFGHKSDREVVHRTRRGQAVGTVERVRDVALAICHGVQNKAAALIQMPLRSFVTKVKRYNMARAGVARCLARERANRADLARLAEIARCHRDKSQAAATPWRENAPVPIHPRSRVHHRL
jgi:hypothetical protein